MVGRTAGGVRSLEEQVVNSRAPKITIYLCTYLHAPFQRCSVNSLHARSTLVLYERACIAATRLVWTAVILSSSETSNKNKNKFTVHKEQH